MVYLTNDVRKKASVLGINENDTAKLYRTARDVNAFLKIENQKAQGILNPELKMFSNGQLNVSLKEKLGMLSSGQENLGKEEEAYGECDERE